MKYPCWANIVKVYRQYGGPEEGGWSYPAEQEVITSRRVHNEPELLKTKESYLSGDIKIGWDPIDCAEVKMTVTQDAPQDAIFPRPSYE